MIKKEIININGRLFTKTFSDKNVYIMRNGILYKDAYNPIEISRTYEESEEAIKD